MPTTLSTRRALSISLEWLTPGIAILRLHEKAGASYGDPYVWWTVLVVREGRDVEMKGADRPLPASGLRAIVKSLRTLGFRRRVHDRIVNGRKRTVLKDL